jgi:hypothetical protein
MESAVVNGRTKKILYFNHGETISNLAGQAREGEEKVQNTFEEFKKGTLVLRNNSYGTARASSERRNWSGFSKLPHRFLLSIPSAASKSEVAGSLEL